MGASLLPYLESLLRIVIYSLPGYRESVFYQDTKWRLEHGVDSLKDRLLITLILISPVPRCLAGMDVHSLEA